MIILIKLKDRISQQKTFKLQKNATWKSYKRSTICIEKSENPKPGKQKVIRRSRKKFRIGKLLKKGRKEVTTDENPDYDFLENSLRGKKK